MTTVEEVSQDTFIVSFDFDDIRTLKSNSEPVSRSPAKELEKIIERGLYPEPNYKDDED